MASLEQHIRDCRQLVGEPCEDVNRWIDGYFNEFGPYHRFKRHHREGIQEAQTLFGDRGRRAAAVHVLRDCRHIPRASDYSDGKVDRLGLVARWPVSAYIHYPEEAFERLVMYTLSGPQAIVNLGFFKSENDLLLLLMSQAGPGTAERDLVVRNRWPLCVAAREKLPSLAESEVFPLSDEQKELASELENHPLVQTIRSQNESVTLGLIRPSSLINPLIWIDLEYVEELRAELIGTDDAAALSFAVPRRLNISARVSVDADGTSASIVSKRREMAVSFPIITPVPNVGFAVTFQVAGLPQFILVSRVKGRFYLRNGMHRAFLLASSGIEKIPAVIVDEEILQQIVVSMPAFQKDILEMERPPLLSDMLDENLTSVIPILRTQKVLRLSVQEMTIPVD